MYIGGTKSIAFEFDTTLIEDLADAISLVAYVMVNNVIKLKYILGEPTEGYDGVITIDPDNARKGRLYITREKSLTLSTGKMVTEAILVTSDENYNPNGKTTIIQADIDTVNYSKTTEE